MSARRVLSLTNRRTGADLMHGTQIDIAPSPAPVAMPGRVPGLRAAAERCASRAIVPAPRRLPRALEIVARGDRRASRRGAGKSACPGKYIGPPRAAFQKARPMVWRAALETEVTGPRTHTGDRNPATMWCSSQFNKRLVRNVKPGSASAPPF